MTTLADDPVPDELWAIVAPFLWRPAPCDPERNCFAAIVFMARTFTPWRLLPARELGCGSTAHLLAPAHRVG